MKKILLLALIAGSITGGHAEAQACKPGGTYFTILGPSPIYYGKIDTVGSSALDSVMASISCKPTSITYTSTVYKVAGSPTVNVACYASADNGVTFGGTAIASFTATPTSLTVPVVNTYIVNNTTGGNPYTTYKWMYTNSASATCSHQDKVLIR